jgi:hypothetical protein
LESAAVVKDQKIPWHRVLLAASALVLVGLAFLAIPHARNHLSTLLAPAKKPSTPPVPLQPVGPFVGIDVTQLTDIQRSVILQAATDFDRARRGLEPTCKFESMGGFSDGGTTIYECPHYRLTIMKGLFSVQGIDGYLYGPIITFSGDNSVSDVRFYTYDELSKHLGGGR